MKLITCGVMHYYINDRAVKIVNRSGTAQTEQAVQLSQQVDKYAVPINGAKVIHDSKPQRVSETTKRMRYKNNVKREHNKGKGLLFSK